MGTIKYFSKMWEYTSTANWETALHKHSFWEIVICMQGQASHTVNGIKCDFNVGDIIIMKPESTHTNTVVDLKEYIAFDFYASLMAMKKACDDIHPNVYELIINDKMPICIKLEQGVLDYIKNKLLQLNTLQSNRENKELALSIYNTVLRLICGMVVEKIIIETNPMPNKISTLLIKMTHPDVLSSNIEDVVKLSNYSHSYLCILFKKHTGLTLVEYFTRLKMEYATQLMKNKSLKILDISSMLGYNSLSHFITIFKRMNDVTPKQYRKQFLHFEEDA